MVRYRITDDDEDTCEWHHDARDEQSASSSMVPASYGHTNDTIENVPSLENHAAMRSHDAMVPEEDTQLGPVGYYQHEQDSPRPHCNVFRISILIALFGIVCQAYLPPAPPPSSYHEDEDTVPSWNAYLQSHSQQWLDSTKALMFHTPWHIVSWLGTAALRDLEHFVTKVSIQRDCTWKIPPSVEAIGQDLAKDVVGQDLAVTLVAEALVAWKAHHPQQEPLKILSIGPKSTGKRTLAHAIASYCTSCETSVVLYIPNVDPRSLRQKAHRIQQHIHQYEAASVVVYHDEALDDVEFENAGRAVLYRISETSGRSVMAESLRTNTWGSASMMADLRSEVSQWPSVILPFAPMTPDILEAILRQYVADSNDFLEHVEYMDWTTKDGSLILRVAIEGARSLPWNRIRAKAVADNTASDLGQ